MRPIALSLLRLAWLAAPLLLCGCLPGAILIPANDRPFDFPADTFAFLNEVEFEYRVDSRNGTTEAVGWAADADWTQRCFTVSRSARQFYQFARFEPQLPPLSADGYRERVRAVFAHRPSERKAIERIVIPGYPDLRSFSAAHEALLKEEIGGKLRNYAQRGNWRMIYPFTRGHQQATAEILLAEIGVNRPPVVHIVTFPELTINHGLLLFGAEATADAIRFAVYDPNDNARPAELVFDRAARQFRYPLQFYFAGGDVDIYEIYKSLLY